MGKQFGMLLVFVVIIGLNSSASGNSELHPGGRLFFPLWDVSTPNRLTYIILTREALREHQSINPVIVETAGTTYTRYTVRGDGKCLPRGKDGSTSNVNRIDLGGTSSQPIFVDDVHLEYYGQSCIHADEMVHMSCGDIDLFLLANPQNPAAKPRFGFDAVAATDTRGALDVHLVTNSSHDRFERKLENSLMGSAVIVDLAEGWMATYAAAAAKALPCVNCAYIDGGTAVGYENYPMEVYLPWAFADLWPTPGDSGGSRTFRNILSLWGPALLPSHDLAGTTVNIAWKWWDGRERPRQASIINHSIIRPLGGPAIRGLDAPIDSAGFNVANFVCGYTAGSIVGRAENDGFPRSARLGADGAHCGPPSIADVDHPSDNFENSGDVNILGSQIQPSTSIGWWRFKLLRDNNVPHPLLSWGGEGNLNHSGRGLVGVVLSASSVSLPQRPPKANLNLPHDKKGIGDATRLWHEDPCEIGQGGDTVGPPHERDKLVEILSDQVNATDYLPLFNTLGFDGQAFLCALGRE